MMIRLLLVDDHNILRSSLRSSLRTVLEREADIEVITPWILDLSKPACRDRIVSHEDSAKWDISNIQELWSGLSAAHC